jgi:hypothetical protein
MGNVTARVVSPQHKAAFNCCQAPAACLFRAEAGLCWGRDVRAVR